MPDGSGFSRAAHEPTFFDRVVLPTAAQTYAQQLGRAQGAGSTSYNPQYYNQPFGRQELERQRQRQQAQQATAGLGASDVLDQLINPQPLSEEGAAEEVTQEVRQHSGQEPVTGEPQGGQGVQVAQGGAPPYGADIQNPFVNKQQMEFEDAVQPHNRARAHKAAKDWIELSRAKAKSPWQAQQLEQQFKQKYPGFDVNLKGISSEKAEELKQELRFQQEQTKVNEFAQKTLGLESIPLSKNAKGEVEISAATSKLLGAELDRRAKDSANQMKMQSEAHKAQLEALEAAKPPEPADYASAQDIENYKQKVLAIEDEKARLNAQQYGYDPRLPSSVQQRATVGRGSSSRQPQFQASTRAQQRAHQMGLPLVQSAQDYAAVPPGEKYVDHQGNVRPKPIR